MKFADYIWKGKGVVAGNIQPISILHIHNYVTLCVGKKDGFNAVQYYMDAIRLEILLPWRSRNKTRKADMADTLERYKASSMSAFKETNKKLLIYRCKDNDFNWFMQVVWYVFALYFLYVKSVIQWDLNSIWITLLVCCLLLFFSRFVFCFSGKIKHVVLLSAAKWFCGL